MTIFDSIRQLLSQGDTAQALRLLITHLEHEKSTPEALRTLRVIEANYNAARQKEIKGILDFSEAQLTYSKANDSLLSVLEDLAAGRTPTLAVESDEKQTSRVYWLIGGGILLLLGLIAGILVRNNQPSAPVVTTPVAAECPDFDTSGLTVMLIPFQDLGDAKSRPELAIQALIRDLTQRNNVKSDVELFVGDLFATNLPDINDAAKIGRRCAAKMVIWGLYEKTDDGISLDVRYVFTEQPNLPGGAVADTFRNLSELRTNSAKFKSLEDAVFTLCTFMVLHEGDMDLAKKWINKVKEPDANAQKLKAMLNK